jgi:hypothetical protein
LSDSFTTRGVRKMSSSCFGAAAGGLEQIAEDRNIAEYRHLGHVVGDRLLEDPADDRGVTVIDVVA